MKQIPIVTRAEYHGAYRIHVVFDDNSEKTIDFRGWLKGPIFEPLRDVNYFRRFFLDGWTVAWPNGADIAPETLHEAADVGNNRPVPNQRLPRADEQRDHRVARR